MARKRKTTGRRKRPPSGDLVNVQLDWEGKFLKGMKPSRQMLEEAFRHKARTSGGQWDGKTVVGAKEGEDIIPGVRLLIKNWSNPDRRKPGLRNKRTGDQAQAWGSLRRIILAGDIAISIRTR